MYNLIFHFLPANLDLDEGTKNQQTNKKQTGALLLGLIRSLYYFLQCNKRLIWRLIEIIIQILKKLV